MDIIDLTTTETLQEESVLRQSSKDFDPKAAEPAKGKQLSAKSWFLTYPQCSVTKEQALLNLQSRFKQNLAGCLIAQEDHQDGMKHLHMLVIFTKAVKTKDRSFFDFVCKKHGNYQTVRSQYAVANYVRKEDPTPVSFGNVPDPGSSTAKEQSLGKRKRDGGKPRESKALMTAQQLLSGASLKSIMLTDPGYYLQNKRKIEEFESLCSNLRMNDSLKEWQTIKYLGEHSETKEIVEWLNSNIKCKRSFRQEQLFLSGPKQTFKTTILELLSQYLRIYEIPKGEDFYDLYMNGEYDLCVMDEFKGHKQIQWLNQFLQGSIMNLRQKGKQMLKRDNLPVIIVSNYSLSECYAKALERDPEKLDTLQSRLKVITLTTPVDIHGLALALGLQDCELMKQLRSHYDARSSVSIIDAPTNMPSVNYEPFPITGQPRVVSITETTIATCSAADKFEESFRRARELRERKRRELLTKGKQPAPDFCSGCGERSEKCNCDMIE